MLTISKISKSFPGVKALSDVQLSVKAGEIHALVGENGAGKSTLTRIIAGVFQPDDGTIEFDGEIVHWASPAEAKAAGIHVIYQEFVLFPSMTVAENIFLGHERKGFMGAIDHGQTLRDARDLLERLGVVIDPDKLVSELSVADQQMVEIAKALVHKVKLLILDEPTAVIAGHEVELLFGRLRALRDDGVAIIYISHRLEEVFDLCDRVTVFKDGQFVVTEPVASMTNDKLVSYMVGRNMSELFPPKAKLGEDRSIILTATDVSVKGRVHNASIELRAGEITALAGMVGAGRTEFALAIFGGLPMVSGQISIGGETFRKITPTVAIAKGIGLLTEDRKGQGLAMLMDVATNISASDLKSVSTSGWLDRGRESAVAKSEIDTYRIACRGPNGAVLTMSGGNQQKVLVARWARTSRKVIIMDEPTRGVDVGAKAEIYKIMRELADRGLAVLMISSEMPEVIGLADCVYVMREGTITGQLGAGEIDEQRIIQLATQKRAS